MQQNERNKLIELTEKAIKVNEKLLADERKFLAAIDSSKDPGYLEQENEMLSELCRKEHLYLSATKSLLQIINKK